jgi:hypothetical protein
MEVNSVAEVLSVEDDVVQIAFDLSGSEPQYLIISLPEPGGEAEHDFFGHDHYVEVKDELFGRYGGLSGISVPSDNRVEVHLALDVPNIGRALTINTQAPMSAGILSHLRRLQSS